MEYKLKSKTVRKLPITPKNQLYWYKGVIRRIVDGDSYHISIDMGCKVILQDRECRGYEYDTWETRRRPPGLTISEWEDHKELGKRATKFCKYLMPVGTEVMVNTHRDKSGKYGRLLVRVYIPSKSGYIDLQRELRMGNYLKNDSQIPTLKLMKWVA